MKIGDQIVILKPEIMEAVQLVSMIKPRACLQRLQKDSKQCHAQKGGQALRGQGHSFL